MNVGVVVAQDFWLHFREIYSALQVDHSVSVFRPRRWRHQAFSERINRFLLHRDLGSFMRGQDVAFFEWGEHEFVTATHLPKSRPIVARLHSHELWAFAPQVDWRQVNLVIFVSHVMDNRFLKRFPDMAGRTTVVHNGVSLDKFRFTARPRRNAIGVLSRIEPHKRIYDLILAIYDLRRQGLDLTLSIGGSVTEPRYERYGYEVQRLVERLGLQAVVRFDGQVADTAAWFRGIDLFVSHSCSEGLQVALLEAMASGCYCLGHHWEGIDEALPADNVYMTERELQAGIQAYFSASAEEQESKQRTLRAIAEERFDIARQKMIVKRLVEESAGRA